MSIAGPVLCWTCSSDFGRDDSSTRLGMIGCRGNNCSFFCSLLADLVPVETLCKFGTLTGGCSEISGV
jgi:hypothetical protein